MKFQACLATLPLLFFITRIDACNRACSNCPTEVKTAKAVFYSGTSVSTAVSGTVTFTVLSNGNTKITGTLQGLPSGEHGFHIHTFGDLSSCSAGSGHYNPFSKNHGAPTASDRHVGDLGNIQGGASTNIDLTDSLVKLNGETSVVGRMLVIHQNRDDLGLGGASDSLTTGNAGSRIACAIIGRAS